MASTVEEMDPQSQESTASTVRFAREPTPEAKITTKQKLKPSVTPRTFKRFFTPRTGNREGLRKRSRDVLSEVSSSGLNSRKRPGNLQVQDETSASSQEHASVWEQTKSSPVHARDDSSPCKRIKVNHVYVEEQAELEESSDDDEEPIPAGPRSIVRSKYRSSLGDCLRRQLYLGAGPQAKTTYTIDPYSDTTGFHSTADDVYVCRGAGARRNRANIPFCSAACNTNSLTAIGDEDGTVRLLETSLKGNRKFADPLLSFKAHNNAILDLQFSQDDKLLATASGDQACQVIDMLTQKATYELKGHVSTVKQIRFQPGSNGSVLATSSRDGSIQIWDLRCKSSAALVNRNEVSISGNQEDLVSTKGSDMRNATRINLIDDAHYTQYPAIDLQGKNTDRRTQPLASRSEPSITALSFLSASNPHILLSAADSQATVKVWDVRSKHSHRNQPVPISSTALPARHNRYRHFGITSMAVSEDSSRLYTLCKDNTVYVYSTSHLALGSGPELYNESLRPRRNIQEKNGTGPLYAFRHEKIAVSSFYVKLSLRPAFDDKPEMLALGSNKTCPILFPTDSNTLRKSTLPTTQESVSSNPFDTPDKLPIYDHGTALIGGHEKEVTSVSWTSEGNLVSLGDDAKVRVWRSGGDNARELRKGEEQGRRWGCGWADIGGEWDDDDC